MPKTPPMPQKKGKVEKVLKEYKAGTLNMGKSAKKVTSKKQAVAIALSEQRRVDKGKKK